MVICDGGGRRGQPEGGRIGQRNQGARDLRRHRSRSVCLSLSGFQAEKPFLDNTAPSFSRRHGVCCFRQTGGPHQRSGHNVQNRIPHLRTHARTYVHIYKHAYSHTYSQTEKPNTRKQTDVQQRTSSACCAGSCTRGPVMWCASCGIRFVMKKNKPHLVFLEVTVAMGTVSEGVCMPC